MQTYITDNRDNNVEMYDMIDTTDRRVEEAADSTINMPLVRHIDRWIDSMVSSIDNTMDTYTMQSR